MFLVSVCISPSHIVSSVSRLRKALESSFFKFWRSSSCFAIFQTHLEREAALTEWLQKTYLKNADVSFNSCIIQFDSPHTQHAS